MSADKMDRYPIWLVWVILPSGYTALRATCTTEATARRYEKYCLKALKVSRVMVEKSLTDHLYFGALQDGLPKKKDILAALKKAGEDYRRKP